MIFRHLKKRVDLSTGSRFRVAACLDAKPETREFVEKSFKPGYEQEMRRLETLLNRYFASNKEDE